MSKLQINETLMDAVIHGTVEGLKMTGVSPPPVGVTRFFNAPRPYSIIVGLVGKDSGSMTFNLGKRGMLYLVGKFLGETVEEVDDDSFDSVMELGNMVAGCIKDFLLGKEYEVAEISLPSLVLGASYGFYYARGIQTVSVEFELEEISVAYTEDRFFSTTISLLRGAGSRKKR